MRYILFLTLMWCLVGSAAAGRGLARGLSNVTTSRGGPAAKGSGDGATVPRAGGDTIESATVIPSLPYTDTGATCGYNHDYDVLCASPGAPDVVYSYTPSESAMVDVSLCGSGYDTALLVYRGENGPEIGCNDDFCGLQSEIAAVPIAAGETYYIVVSGYGSACGGYVLNVTALTPCDLACPPGGIAEAEPPCEDGYVDQYNDGCGAYPAWSPIQAGADGCAMVCGKSCTYVSDGMHYRDTDWYEAAAAGGPVTVTCEAEFPVRTVLVNPTDCLHWAEGEATEPLPCEAGEISHSYPSGAVVWILVEPTSFDYALPESDYVFTVCGLVPGATPARKTTWGMIKNTYRDSAR